MNKVIKIEHERDAAWLIALHLAIYGGDPSPIEQISQDRAEAAALHAIKSLSEALSEETQIAVRKAIAPAIGSHELKTADEKTITERLKALGVEFVQHAAEHADAVGTTEDLVAIQRPPYCIKFRGEIYCIHFPRVVLGIPE